MITNTKEFCKFFHASTTIPIGCYSTDSTCNYFFPSINEKEDRFFFDRKMIDSMHFTKNPDYFISQSFGYSGYVKQRNTNNIIIIGPLFSTPPSDLILRTFMKEWAISSDYKPDIEQFLEKLPIYSFHQFLQVLIFLHLCLNDEVIDIEGHFNLKLDNINSEFSTLHSNQLFEAKENQNFHNSYYFEQELMQYIQQGDVNKLNNLLTNQANGISVGILANNSLRQEKNLFISSIAIAMRSAIAGGMDMEQAYQLSDLYITECEKSQDIAQVASISHSMLLDFAGRVAKSQIPKGMSREIYNCVQFISQHTNEPIQVTDVAAYIGKSRSYLTSKFKKELGFDVSKFIMRCKLEEAKSLLTYSDKSLSEISSYLCFSSQAYFHNVFKKKYGMTPAQYRNEVHKI